MKGGGRLRRLGIALHVVQNKLILRGEAGGDRPIWVNSLVVDRNKRRVGRVFEIFGPVEQPYIVVRPNRGIDVTAHVGKKLYVDEASRRDGKWKS